MREQKFTDITAAYKNELIKFAKRNRFSFNVDKQGKKLFNVVIYCSSEAMEGRW